MSSSASRKSRRGFLKDTGSVAAASALAGTAIPNVHAASKNQLNLALVGCGGRGTGAAVDALDTSVLGPINLVAMADVFDNRLKSSYAHLQKQKPDQVTVIDDRKFVSFEAYKQAMDCLDPGDIVILTTPPAFRWLHFTYAIERGLNVFMEKPVTVDGPSTRKMLALGEKAKEKNLKVAVGLMCRHCRARGELFDRVRDGQIGEVLALRAYRMAGTTGSADVSPKPEGITELEHQIKNFHGFLWLSGGAYSDFLIHNIDECCWIKDAWPVEAKSSGGRHYRGDYVDQNFDSYSTEYTFADGTKLFMNGRTIPGCHYEFASYAHGSKSAATISARSHAPSRARIFKGQKYDNNEVAWKYANKEPNPYKMEWIDFVEAIRKDEPYSEVERGAKASLVTSMGRMAAHTGRVVTFDEILNHDHEFAPGLDKLTMDGPAPVQANEDGKYPIPTPGIQTKREY